MKSLFFLKVKLLLPGVEIVTASEPEIALAPDQDPDAVQEVALVEDQVRVEVSVTRTVKGLAERDTVAAGAEEPPPPQEVRTNIAEIK